MRLSGRRANRAHGKVPCCRSLRWSSSGEMPGDPGWFVNRHNGAPPAFIALHPSPRFRGAFFTTVLCVRLEGERERAGSSTTMTDCAAPPHSPTTSACTDHHHHHHSCMAASRHSTPSSVTKSTDARGRLH